MGQLSQPLSSLGAANSLRPQNGFEGNWNAVYAWQNDNLPKADQQVTANAQGYQLAVSNGNSLQTTVNPQSVYDQIASQGQTLFYLEIWFNKIQTIPLTDLLDDYQYVYIAVYG